MQKTTEKQNFKKYIAVLILAGILFSSLVSSSAFAQGTTGTGNQQESPSSSQSGSSITADAALAAGKLIAAPAIGTMAAVLFAIKTVLGWCLSVAGEILNYVFQKNISLNPGDWTVVRVGWGISRDIANSVFILLLLWIAFTMIFGMEKYGGNKLFVRVVVVALLINFSLVAVTAVFGISNAVANVFAKSIEHPSESIANLVKLQTVYVSSSDAELETALLQQQQRVSRANSRPSFGFKDTLLASVGFAPATAQDEEPAPGDVRATATSGGDTTGVFNKIISFVSSPFDSFFNMVLDSAAAIIFILIMLAAFLVGATALLIRMLMMIILSIFAPLAMLAWVAPSPEIQKYWKKWTSMLFSWAFFAPGFYFLFYLSLLFLQTYDGAAGGAVNGLPVQQSHLSIDRIIQNVLSLGLMIAAVKLAKTTGGAVTDAVMSGLQKVGTLALGAATGGAAAGAAVLARRAAPSIEKGAESLAGRPILGKITAPVTRRVQDYVKEQQDAVKKTQKGYADKNTDYLVQEIKRSVSAQDKIGALLALLEKEGGAKKAADAGINFGDMAKMASRFGPGASKEIYKIRPDLAPTSADRLRTMRGMNENEIKNIQWGQIPSTQQQNILNELFATSNPAKFNRMVQGIYQTPDANAKNQVLEQLKSIISDKNTWDKLQKADPTAYEEYTRHLVGNPMRKMGGVLDIPQEVKEAVGQAALAAQQAAQAAQTAAQATRTTAQSQQGVNATQQQTAKAQQSTGQAQQQAAQTQQTGAQTQQQTTQTQKNISQTQSNISQQQANQQSQQNQQQNNSNNTNNQGGGNPTT